MKEMKLLTIMMSSLMAMSSSNWLNMWFMLEINTMSFVSWINSPKESESAMKYFLNQSVASIPILISITMSMMDSSQTSIWNPIEMTNLLMMSMMMKMGAAPFHFWVVQIVKPMAWKKVFMLLSVQKIAPLMIMCNNINMKMMSMFIIMSSIMGSVSMFLVSNIKTILVMSSVVQISWMMMSSTISAKLTMTYIILYSYSMLMMTKIMLKNKMNSMSWKENSESKNLMTMNMLSMGGMPPTMGFIPKAMVMKNSSKNMPTQMLMMIMIFSSIMSMMIYMKMSSKNMISTKKMSNMKQNKKTKMPILMIQMSMPMVIIYMW